MVHSEMEILLQEAEGAIKCAKIKLHENTDNQKFKEYVAKAVEKLDKLLNNHHSYSSPSRGYRNEDRSDNRIHNPHNRGGKNDGYGD